MSDKDLNLVDLSAYLESLQTDTQSLNEGAHGDIERGDGTVDEDKLITPPADAEGDVQTDDGDDMSPELEQFCMQCMRMYSNVHLWHLQTGSYAEHEALEEFYNALFELTDSFIEAAIANFGALCCSSVYTLELLPYDEMVDEIEAFKKHVGQQKETITEEGMVNLLDEMLTTTDSVLYKLKNLK